MRSLLLALAVILSSASAQATTYTIYADGSGDYPTIQDAIDDSANGDVIQLGNGRFTGAGNRSIDTQGQYISLVSISDDPTLCVIDLQGWEDPIPGILFEGQGPSTLLRGISIINGNSSASGGAVVLQVASPTIENCIFQDNYAYMHGGAIYAPEGSSPVIRNCIFRRNEAFYYGLGGALYFSEGGFPHLEGCSFEGNTAYSGGALMLDLDATATISSSTFYGNTGDAISIQNSSSLTMGTSVMVGNDNTVAAYESGGTAQLNCCDVYGNTGGNYTDLIAGQGGVNNNIEANPYFLDPDNGDFRLSSSSPCAAPNNPNCGQIGAWGLVSSRVIAVFPQGLYTIQDAISQALDGDVVELQDGTYSGDGNRDVSFLGKAITVRSASDNPTNCQIDCEGVYFDFHNGFNFTSGEGSDSILRGITIRNGYNGLGGAVRSEYSSPTLENCHFIDNIADSYGGAVYTFDGDPIITGCEFRENTLGNTSGSGCALFVGPGVMILTDCVFFDNGEDFAGIDNNSFGGAVCIWDSLPESIISGCVFGNNQARSGGALDIRIGSYRVAPEITDCTMVNNRAQYGSAIHYLGVHGIPNATINNTLIAFNSGVGNQHFGNDWLYMSSITPTVQFSCSNVFGNEGGDWVGRVADQADLSNNLFLNPRFCDQDNQDYQLEATSPCLPGSPDNPSCGLIGALDIGCDYRALVTSVADVPNDQGRRVRVSWNASEQDAYNAPYAITGYSIWRRIEDPARKAILPPKGEAIADSRFPAGDWDYLASVPAGGESQYNVLCETLADSTVSGGMHLSTFFVRAQSAIPTFNFDSEPASGYSVDNLAPAAPGNLRLETPDLLAWDEIAAIDFNYFTVYGSQSEILDGTAVQLATTVGLSLDVTGSSYPFYLLTATDFSGNEGQAAALATGVSAVEGGPTRFALYPAWPNPGTGSTTFSFDLPQASKVSLSVYDLAGRRVATLVNSEMPAGTHMVPWNGQVNGTTGPLASGVYFYRLQAGTFNDSGRVVILK